MVIMPEALRNTVSGLRDSTRSMVVSFDSFYVYVIETSTGDDGETRDTPFSARSCSAVRCRGECRVYCLGSEGNQHKFELGNTLQVTVRRDGSEVAFQSGRRDEG